MRLYPLFQVDRGPEKVELLSQTSKANWRVNFPMNEEEADQRREDSGQLKRGRKNVTGISRFPEYLYRDPRRMKILLGR
jgi:hypothetical protein